MLLMKYIDFISFLISKNSQMVTSGSNKKPYCLLNIPQFKPQTQSRGVKRVIKLLWFVF